MKVLPSRNIAQHVGKVSEGGAIQTEISSASTSAAFLETDVQEGVTVRDIVFRLARADIEFLGRAVPRVDVPVADMRFLLPTGSFTVEVKAFHAEGEAGGSSREAAALERLNESFWILVGEVRRKFQEIVPGDVHIYTLDDGAFVVDTILDGGRAACILRRLYAHLMILTEDEMVDKVLHGEEASPSRIQSELQSALGRR